MAKIVRIEKKEVLHGEVRVGGPRGHKEGREIEIEIEIQKFPENVPQVFR